MVTGMKANIRFLFLVILLFTIAHTTIQSLVAEKKAEYSTGDIFYVSNNPYGVKADAADVVKIVKDLDANVIAKDADGRVYFSNFSGVILDSGRYPESPNEYISVVDKTTEEQRMSEASQQVGTYKESLSVNGFGDIYFLSEGKTLAILQIEMQKAPDLNQEKALRNKGFVQINAQNLDRQIQAETYTLIDLVINLVSITLLFMALISWISYVCKLVVDRHAELETLTSFGMSRQQIPLVFLAVRRQSLLRACLETAIVFLLAGGLAFFVLSHMSILNFLLAWLLAWSLILLTIYFAVFVQAGKVLGLKSRGTKFMRILPLVIAAAALFLAGLSSSLDSKFWFFLLLLLVLFVGLRRAVLLKALYGSIGSSTFAILFMIAIVVTINSISFSLWTAMSSKEEITVVTSLPYKAVIRTDVLPAPYNQSQDFYKYAYINPIDGVLLAGKQAFPLIYSVDLQKYAPYNIEGDEIQKDSVLIGAALAVRNQAVVGSELVINGKTLKVTNIVYTEQYAGMMIYLSLETFTDIFGNTGNTIWFTDLDVSPLESMLSPGSSIHTRESYRQLYQASVSSFQFLILSLSAILLLISAFIAYQLLSVYINSIIWRVNVLRGFGLRFLEFAIPTTLHLLMIGCAAVTLVLAFAKPLTSKVTSMILENTDAYIPISVSPFVILVTLVGVIIFSFLISVLTYRSMSRLSIYQQYLQCSNRS